VRKPWENSVRNFIFRTIAANVSVMLFLTNSLLASAPEINFRSQRQKAFQQSQQNQKSPTLLASLPSNYPMEILNGLPALTPSPFVVSKQIQRQIPKGSERRFASLLQALPPAYGSVRNLTVPTAGANGKTIIYLQDVHLNPEAQENLARTLQELIDQKATGLIALEGAFAPIDLSVFRRTPYKKSVKAVADYLLKEKRISGPAYTALVSPATVPPFVGVDDRRHYEANVQAYRSSELLAKNYKQRLSALETAHQEKKERIFNKDLLNFDAEMVSYRLGKKSWGDYVGLLANKTPVLSPDVKIFLEALNVESSLDFGRVEAERTKIVAQLVPKLNKAQMSNLLNRSVAYRIGNLSQADFYHSLRTLCAENGVALQNYKAFDGYIRYVLLVESINVEKVLSETAQMEKSAYASLATAASEKELVKEGKYLAYAGKLLEFSLTSEEWDDYQFLKENKPALDLSSFEVFYLEARERDQAMTENLMKAMDHAKVTTAVLVTGGFHSNGITERLKKEGIASILFSPKITKVDDESGSSYLSVFNQTKTPLDRLFQGEKLFTAPKVFPGQTLETIAESAAGVSYVQGATLPEAVEGFDLLSGTEMEKGGTPGGTDVAVKTPGAAAEVDTTVNKDGEVTDLNIKKPDLPLKSILIAFGTLLGAASISLASGPGALSPLENPVLIFGLSMFALFLMMRSMKYVFLLLRPDTSRRSFLRLAVGTALVATLLGSISDAQTKKPAAKPSGPTPSLLSTFETGAFARRFELFLGKLKRPNDIFYRSNIGDPVIGDAAFLYENATLAQIFLSEDSQRGLSRAVQLLGRIAVDWKRRPDVFVDQENTKQITRGAFYTAVNPLNGTVEEHKVDSGSIFHLGIAAINAREMAKRKDPSGFKNKKYDFLLALILEVADYAESVRGPKGGVYHGPWGKAEDFKDQHFVDHENNVVGSAMALTYTKEHQPEAYFIWNYLSRIESLDEKTREGYAEFADKVKAFDLDSKTFWDQGKHRFHGSLGEDGKRSDLLPTDQVWSISMYGLEALIEKFGLAEIERMFKALDTEHSVEDKLKNIIGYDFGARKEFVSIEFTGQVAAAKLQMALYLRSHPEEAKKIETPWNAYAGAAVQLLRRFSTLQSKYPSQAPGLPYAINADGTFAEGKKTLLGFNTHTGESLIPWYILAVGRGYDPAALGGGKIKADLQKMLAELKPEDYEPKKEGEAFNPDEIAKIGENVLLNTRRGDSSDGPKMVNGQAVVEASAYMIVTAGNTLKLRRGERYTLEFTASGIPPKQVKPAYVQILSRNEAIGQANVEAMQLIGIRNGANSISIPIDRNMAEDIDVAQIIIHCGSGIMFGNPAFNLPGNPLDPHLIGSMRLIKRADAPAPLKKAPAKKKTPVKRSDNSTGTFMKIAAMSIPLLFVLRMSGGASDENKIQFKPEMKVIELLNVVFKSRAKSYARNVSGRLADNGIQTLRELQNHSYHEIKWLISQEATAEIVRTLATQNLFLKPTLQLTWESLVFDLILQLPVSNAGFRGIVERAVFNSGESIYTVADLWQLRHQLFAGKGSLLAALDAVIKANDLIDSPEIYRRAHTMRPIRQTDQKNPLAPESEFYHPSLHDEVPMSSLPYPTRASESILSLDQAQQEEPETLARLGQKIQNFVAKRGHPRDKFGLKPLLIALGTLLGLSTFAVAGQAGRTVSKGLISVEKLIIPSYGYDALVLGVVALLIVGIIWLLSLSVPEPNESQREGRRSFLKVATAVALIPVLGGISDGQTALVNRLEWPIPLTMRYTNRATGASTRSRYLREEQESKPENFETITHVRATVRTSDLNNMEGFLVVVSGDDRLNTLAVVKFNRIKNSNEWTAHRVNSQGEEELLESPKVTLANGELNVEGLIGVPVKGAGRVEIMAGRNSSQIPGFGYSTELNPTAPDIYDFSGDVTLIQVLPGSVPKMQPVKKPGEFDVPPTRSESPAVPIVKKALPNLRDEMAKADREEARAAKQALQDAEAWHFYRNVLSGLVVVSFVMSLIWIRARKSATKKESVGKVDDTIDFEGPPRPIKTQSASVVDVTAWEVAVTSLLDNDPSLMKDKGQSSSELVTAPVLLVGHENLSSLLKVLSFLLRIRLSGRDIDVFNLSETKYLAALLINIQNHGEVDRGKIPVLVIAGERNPRLNAMLNSNPEQRPKFPFIVIFTDREQFNWYRTEKSNLLGGDACKFIDLTEIKPKGQGGPAYTPILGALAIAQIGAWLFSHTGTVVSIGIAIGLIFTAAMVTRAVMPELRGMNGRLGLLAALLLWIEGNNPVEAQFIPQVQETTVTTNSYYKSDGTLEVIEKRFSDGRVQYGVPGFDGIVNFSETSPASSQVAIEQDLFGNSSEVPAVPRVEYLRDQAGRETRVTTTRRYKADGSLEVVEERYSDGRVRYGVPGLDGGVRFSESSQPAPFMEKRASPKSPLSVAADLENTKDVQPKPTLPVVATSGKTGYVAPIFGILAAVLSLIGSYFYWPRIRKFLKAIAAHPKLLAVGLLFVGHQVLSLGLSSSGAGEIARSLPAPVNVGMIVIQQTGAVPTAYLTPFLSIVVVLVVLALVVYTTLKAIKSARSIAAASAEDRAFLAAANETARAVLRGDKLKLVLILTDVDSLRLSEALNRKDPSEDPYRKLARLTLAEVEQRKPQASQAITFEEWSSAFWAVLIRINGVKTSANPVLSGTVGYAVDSNEDMEAQVAEVNEILAIPGTTRVALVGKLGKVQELMTTALNLHGEAATRVSLAPTDFETMENGFENVDVMIAALQSAPIPIENATLVFRRGYVMSKLVALANNGFVITPLDSYLNGLLGHVVSLEQADRVQNQMRALISA